MTTISQLLTTLAFILNFTSFNLLTIIIQLLRYLGFYIERHTIQPITSKIDFPNVKNKKQSKIFIGLDEFYSTWIPNYPKLMDPLIKLISRKYPFQWSKDHDKIFKQVQKVFFSKPFLSLPDWSSLSTWIQMKVVQLLLVFYKEGTAAFCQ